MRDAIVQVLGGLLMSGGISLVMFVVILYVLLGEVQAIGSPLLWVGIMYVPFLVIGSLSILRNMKAFGSTLIVMGLVSAPFFYWAVNNTLTHFVIIA